MKKESISITRIKNWLKFSNVLYFVLIAGIIYKVRDKQYFISFSIISITALLVCFFISWHCVKKISKNMMALREKEAERQRFESIIKKAEKLQNQEQRVLKFHHDIKNHLGIIRSLVENDNREEAKKYILKLQHKLIEENYDN